MTQFIFRLPDVGEGTTEAEIVAWHVAVGDRVEEDQPLADVMTDKATVEMTTPVSGVIVALHGELGEMAPVGQALATIEVEGDDAVAAPAKAASAPTAQPANRPRSRRPHQPSRNRGPLETARTVPVARAKATGPWPPRPCVTAPRNCASIWRTCRDPAPPAGSARTT